MFVYNFQIQRFGRVIA